MKVPTCASSNPILSPAPCKKAGMDNPARYHHQVVRENVCKRIYVVGHTQLSHTILYIQLRDINAGECKHLILLVMHVTVYRMS